ncbi:hypothetical protein WJX72_004718 [[Myrmecia] bisecta]|uniref:Mitochondrial Rho GTPase n=1 Tax=[Myrmecia] bisecta TaxID=41462 RepID=A0AAW1R684_9CHLO
MASVRTVKIAVIGDEGVGKTSLITAAATESFPDNPPPVLPPARLPPESTPENVPIVLIDTSSRVEDKQTLETAVLHSDVVVLVFSLDKPATLRRISTFWMPELQRLGVAVPIVLVASKSDVSSDQGLQQAVVPIMGRFKEIETCLECSAKKLTYVGEVFYYALKAVMHPTAPLFDPGAQEGQGALRPLCIKALKRIFLMCDTDKDGALSDEELNAFQIKCFSAPLQPEELVGVKRVVAEKMPQGVNATGLTLPGFLFLHALFIERGRLETTWAVLRKFGYNDSLTLSDAVLDQVSFQHAPDQVVELTEAGVQFFEHQFAYFDRNHDGLLSGQELEDMFSTSPSSPWSGAEYHNVLAETGGPSGWLTLPGYLAKWRYTTAVSPRTTLAYIYYLGSEANASEFFSISKPRKQERKDPAPRSVFQCHVFGAAGAGKTAVLEGLVAQPHPLKRPKAQRSMMAVGQVERKEGPPATLIMRELDEAATSKLLNASNRAEQLAAADVAAFVFDSSDPASFRTAQRLILEVAAASGDSLPCVFVAAKDDLGMSQDLVSECGAVCASLQLRQPLSISAKVGSPAAVYGELIGAALQPELFTPLTPSLKAARQYRRILRRALIYTAAGTVTAAAAYAVYRVYTARQASAESASTSGYSAADARAIGRDVGTSLAADLASGSSRTGGISSGSFSGGSGRSEAGGPGLSNRGLGIRPSDVGSSSSGGGGSSGSGSGSWLDVFKRS